MIGLPFKGWMVNGGRAYGGERSKTVVSNLFMTYH